MNAIHVITSKSTGFFFSDEFVAAMVDDALNANQLLAGDTVVPHLFLGVDQAKVAFFHDFLLLNCVVERNEVLRQLFGLKILLQGCSANGTESHFLHLDLDKALLTKSVAAVEIAWHLGLVVEELVAGRTLHVKFPI